MTQKVYLNGNERVFKVRVGLVLAAARWYIKRLQRGCEADHGYYLFVRIQHRIGSPEAAPFEANPASWLRCLIRFAGIHTANWAVIRRYADHVTSWAVHNTVHAHYSKRWHAHRRTAVRLRKLCVKLGKNEALWSTDCGGFHGFLAG